MLTCTPAASRTVRQASMAAGVVPQSSCSLKPAAPPRNCSHMASADTVLPLPSSATFSGQVSSASSMRARCQAPGRDGGGLAALGGAGAAGDDRGDAAAERLLHDLRTDQVHVAVDGAGGDDAAVARDDLGGGPDHQVGCTPDMMSGLPALPIADDAAVANADVGLDDSPVVDDHRAGDDGVGRAVGAGGAATGPSTRAAPCRRRTPLRRRPARARRCGPR